MRQLLSEVADVKATSDRDLEFREAARAASGLSLFPGLSAVATASSSAPETTSVNAASPRLLDVEAIAIYW